MHWFPHSAACLNSPFLLSASVSCYCRVRRVKQHSVWAAVTHLVCVCHGCVADAWQCSLAQGKYDDAEQRASQAVSDSVQHQLETEKTKHSVRSSPTA